MVVASPLRAVSLSPDSALTSSAVVRHHRSIRGVNIVVPPRARRGLAMMSTAPSATALMMAVLAVSGELLAKSSAASSVDASVESEESTRIHVTDVHARDPKGFTTLHLAADKGNAESITTQLEQGADINAMSRKGTTPLHLAAAKGKKDAAAVLVAAGAILNVASATGDTPLHLAADKGHTAVVKILLDAGADPDLVNSGGLTPLHMASHGGRLDAVNALLAGGASPDAKSSTGQTPLHFAANAKNNKDVVLALLNAGANASAEDSGGHTPVMYATDESTAQVFATNARKHDEKEDL